jgi:hypothetical protein
VPLHPSVEGPLLVLLHLASALPRYIAAAAAPAAQGAGAGGSSAVGQSSAGQQLQVLLPASPLVEIFGGLNPADAEAGAALMADPARLAKLKRELFIRCVRVGKDEMCMFVGGSPWRRWWWRWVAC